MCNVFNNLKVYITFVIIIIFAGGIVFSKICIYDWWWKAQKVLMKNFWYLTKNFDWKEQSEVFVPLKQDEYSNIKYTGNGFIPEDFIQFHTKWKKITDKWTEPTEGTCKQN